MEFTETIIPYHHNISWIDEQVQSMINCMNSDKLPDSHMSCENCAYARQRTVVEGV